MKDFLEQQLRLELISDFQLFLPRGLRGLANIKVYLSFVYVLDSLGPSSEHNCEVCQTIKNEINETVKDWKVKVQTGTEHVNNNYTKIAQKKYWGEKGE